MLKYKPIFFLLSLLFSISLESSLIFLISKYEIIGKNRITKDDVNDFVKHHLSDQLRSQNQASISSIPQIDIPNFDKFGKPDLYSYHAAMFQQADAELTKIRHDIPNAKGLWVVPSIYFAN